MSAARELEHDPSAGRDESELTLAELIDLRLRVHGIGPDDPGLQQIRAINADAAARWTGPKRRTQAMRNAWRA